MVLRISTRPLATLYIYSHVLNATPPFFTAFSHLAGVCDHLLQPPGVKGRIVNEFLGIQPLTGISWEIAP
jgi:hypothetical protein